jgi:hypothetical protein
MTQWICEFCEEPAEHKESSFGEEYGWCDNCCPKSKLGRVPVIKKTDDDPTTKPCGIDPGCNGTLVRDHGHDDSPCDICHGTGRVPLTTGELLDALRERLGDGAQLCGVNWVARLKRWQVVIMFVAAPTARFDGDTPDDALRAALRSING